MSASLVGSEMCIRDSSDSSEGAPGPQPPDKHATAREAKKQTSTCRWMTVSYTHLTLPTICSV
eukprot:12901447-Alexandrium_andersonii.AAC.1